MKMGNAAAILLTLFLHIRIHCFFAFDARTSAILTTLWKMDAHRPSPFSKYFSLKQSPGDGILRLMISTDYAPTNSLRNDYEQLCDKLLRTTPAEHEEMFITNMGGVQNEIEAFIQALNASSMFQKAALMFKYVELSAGRQKCEDCFLENVRELFFSPMENPPFISLFCQFTSDSGNWISFLREQRRLKVFGLKRNRDEVLLVKFIQEGFMRNRRVLLGTSIEFEISTLAICALLRDSVKLNWKHCSAMLDDSKQFDLIVKMKEEPEGPHQKIDAYFTQILRKKKPKPKKDPELQALVLQLWEKDSDRISEAEVSLNWQGQLKKSQVKDISPDPLFTGVDESFLRRPIYQALSQMYEEKVFHEQVCEQEPYMDEERRAKFAKLWTLITDSEVFGLAYQFLRERNKTEHDFAQFREKMFNFWFGAYSRCEDNEKQEPLGSSGFEHVFSGEWRQGIVEGHHNWVHFYLQEKAGDINYHGYFEHQKDNMLGTFQYKWKGFLKRIGGFFFRTSPAFDFSLFTVCALTHYGNEACQFELLDTKMFVTSFTVPCENGTCVATTYPGIWFESPLPPPTPQPCSSFPAPYNSPNAFLSWTSLMVYLFVSFLA